MAERIRRGNKRIRGSDGKRTRNEECCCEEECTAATAQAICEYLRDNAYLAKVDVTSGDFSGTCVSGDCNGLIGFYTLPFFSTAGITDNHEIRWRDTFTITTCDVSRSVVALAVLTLLDLGSTYSCTVEFSLSSIGTLAVVCKWGGQVEVTSCASITGLILSGDATGSPGGSVCKTDIGSDGPVDIEISP